MYPFNSSFKKELLIHVVMYILGDLTVFVFFKHRTLNNLSYLFFTTDRSLNLSDPLKLQSISESELTLLVVNHLLGRLATSSCHLIDKKGHKHTGNHCLCGEDSCKMTGWYGDTSIGEK